MATHSCFAHTAWLRTFLCAPSGIITCRKGCCDAPSADSPAALFAEHGRDLGSSKQTDGNPSLWLGKPGRGTAVGTGVRLGPCRLEVTRDLTGGKPTWWAQFGERF